MYCPCHDETLYQIWAQSSNPRWSYCDFNILPNDLARRVSCARLWDNFHNLSVHKLCVFFMLIRYVTLWPWPLTSWTLDLKLLQHFDCYAFKLCTKFERNRIIRGWVIDDLACFRRTILGGGAQLTDLSQGWIRPRASIMPLAQELPIFTNYNVVCGICINISYFGVQIGDMIN